MTVKELEHMLGMSRANIRYYEQEGLLRPERRKNGYRNYSEQDMEELKKIKLMRLLGVSLADIRKLQADELELSLEMQRCIRELEKQLEENSRAAQMCRSIQREQESYQKLDADRYLNHELFPDGAEAEDFLAEDSRKSVPPFCRYAARAFDGILFYETVICIVSLFRINYLNICTLPWTAVLQILWLFTEPFFLCFTGTTAGKWIFGFYLEDLDGKRLSYRDALIRTVKVYFYGMGLHIPVFSQYRLYKSYKTAADGWRMPWDDEIRYVKKNPALYRIKYARLSERSWSYGLSAAVLLAGFVVSYGCILYAQTPVNRGRLSLEEFVENYNQTARFMGYTGYLYQMKPDGTFYTSEESRHLQSESADGAVSVNLIDSYKTTDFKYSYEGNKIKQISLNIALEDYPEESYVVYPRIQMMLAVLAFAGAQDNIRFWSNERGRTAAELLETGFMECCSCRMGDMDITCNAGCSGFIDCLGYAMAESPKNYFRLDFSITAF